VFLALIDFAYLATVDFDQTLSGTCGIKRGSWSIFLRIGKQTDKQGNEKR
jgi:hypothetical protein